MKIVVGVDGSEHSLRAVAWCARYAPSLHAEVIAVHSIEVSVYASTEGYLMPGSSSEDRESLRRMLVEQWCEPLVRANVPVRPVLTEGQPAKVIRDTANAEHADLVVVGRRGRRGFTELLLGSTSHQLSHHVDRPLAIIP